MYHFTTKTLIIYSKVQYFVEVFDCTFQIDLYNDLNTKSFHDIRIVTIKITYISFRARWCSSLQFLTEGEHTW